MSNSINPTKVKIVPLTKQYATERADEILALEHNWAEIGDEAWDLKKLMETLPLKWKLSHAALLNGNIVGYQVGCLRDVRDGLPTYLVESANGKVLQPYLKKLVVDRESRGLGVGRKLLRPFLENLLSQGHNRVLFRVRSDNPAVRFYDKLGFHRIEEIDRTRPDGITSFFYDTVVSDVLPKI